jgi:hypothetical protein
MIKLIGTEFSHDSGFDLELIHTAVRGEHLLLISILDDVEWGKNGDDIEYDDDHPEMFYNVQHHVATEDDQFFNGNSGGETILRSNWMCSTEAEAYEKYAELFQQVIKAV